jgi:hypothetical protein
MAITQSQWLALSQMVITTEPDAIGCDECFGRVAEYAELQMSRLPIPLAMKAIQRHLEQCPCCRDEYRALLESL